MTTAIRKYLSKIGSKGGSVSGGRKADTARANVAKARAVKAAKTAGPALRAVNEGSQV
jgi:hypothetical protein